MASVVFFDVGGTLLHEDPSIPEVFSRVAQRRGHVVETADVLPCMPRVDEFYQREYSRDGDFWCDHDRSVQLWLDMYSMMADFCGLSDDGLARAVYDEYLLPQNWALFEDAQICVKELKRRGYRLGIVSNWDATLENLIRRLGYLPYFDVVVSSAAVGYRKPDKAIFEIALERMDAAAGEAVHVGDLPDADGEGAEGAGIRPVIIDRKGRFKDCPFDRVDSLTALPDVL